MATLDTFERAIEDIPRTATLTDDDGNVFDTSDFLTIEVNVFHKYTRNIIGTYTLAGGTVTQEIPTTDGQISFIVLATETADQQTGIYQWQIETTETDTDYPANTRHRSFIGDCFKLNPEA